MSTLYWLSVLGNLGALALIVFGGSLITCLLTSFEYFDPKGIPAIKRACKISFICLFISLPVGILIPSKNELYAIYGVGSVINYAKDNKDVQKLPDNTVKDLENIQKNDSTNNK